MRLDFALLARSATAANGEAFIHGAGIRSLIVNALPAVMPLAVVVRMDADPEDAGTQHALGLRVFEPLLLEPTAAPPPMTFEIQALPDQPEDAEIGVLATIQIGGIRLSTAGEYRFELLLDGERLTVLPLRVRAGTPTPLPPQHFSGELGQAPAEEIPNGESDGVEPPAG